jgi:outer membrane protein assembly factor BamB
MSLIALVMCLACFFAVVHETQAAAPRDAAAFADEVVERVRMRRGLALVLGNDGNVPLELARGSELLVHVRDPNRKAITALQTQADEAGLDIQRLTAETGTLSRLPHADNMVDLVLTTRASGKLLGALKAAEVLRVLRPEGQAIFGAAGDADAATLTAWVKKSEAQDVKSWKDDDGVWIAFTKPSMKGAGDWSHWEHGPDNNPVSTDTVIKAPYMTQFMATPYYIGMPSITTAAAGRTFLAIGHIAHHRREWNMLNKLIARNGYNGTVLWERSLPEGYFVHRSAFIATKDTFYMAKGNHALLLDPQTGKELGEIRLPGVRGDWKWMVLQNDRLYVLTGPKGPGAKTTKGDRSFGGWSWADLSRGYYSRPHVPWGFGNTLVAYDVKAKKILWKHSEKQPIDSRSLSMNKGRLFLYCPKTHMRALDTKKGAIVWTNKEKELLDLIEEPGKGLTSTPGFRSACLVVATPDALIVQGQTRNNVVAVSTSAGFVLWSKKKVTNNPNAIFVDGKVILGVGPGGSHVAIEPRSGDVLENLKFNKRACTRLTACSDSFFVRGEGTLRYDREKKKVLVDGAVRPACNDGALPANGLLYLGPWQCDCNLSLIGRVAKCPAGDFKFDITATNADRLDTGDGDVTRIAKFEVTDRDWPTYRADAARSASTTVSVARNAGLRWSYKSSREHLTTVATSAGGLIFAAGEDGIVRAIDAATREIKWQYATPSTIKYPPTIANGRAYFGSGDGYAYCVEAATGRLLWRFRAAPVERHIMIYGSLTSTWPVQTGVLVQDGVAYFAAGIIDHDGTYVYAVDAKTGRLKWQNNSSGHLSDELRKGVSAQGNLSIRGNQLLLAGGNQVSPAAYDLATGECSAKPLTQGQPKANNGKFVGVFADKHAIIGGRILYSSPRNVSTKGSFSVVTGNRSLTLLYGGVAPAWDGKTLAMVNFQNGELTCCEADKVQARLEKGYPKRPAGTRRFRLNLSAAFKTDGAVRWTSDLGESNKFEALSLAVCPNAILAVVQFQQKYRAQPQWYVVAFDKQKGAPLWRQELRDEPLPGGLLVDRDGRVIVSMLAGGLTCFAGASE